MKYIPLLVSVSASLYCSPAYAGGSAQSSAPHSKGAAESLSPNDVVVTGSRLSHLGSANPGPIVRIRAEQLQSSGTVNLVDYLTNYPQLVGSSTAAMNAGAGARDGRTGLTVLNLRNLGAERTLVLVNGRRHVAALPGTQAVDANTIPLALLDRVEIMTGGASAVYGSDGVSGVVNFILRNSASGLEARALAGISSQGDAAQRLLSLVSGGTLLGSKAQYILAYEYGREDRLAGNARASLSGRSAVAFHLNPEDPENQLGYTGPSDNGIPDNIPLHDIRFFDTSREGAIDLDKDGRPEFIIGKGRSPAPFDPGRFVPPFYQQGGSGTLVADYDGDLLPQIDRHLLHASGRLNLSPSLSLFAEASGSRIRSFSINQPTFDYYLFIEPDNAFLPSNFRGEVAKQGGALLNRDHFDLGVRGEDIVRNTRRVLVGIEGEAPGDISYQAYYSDGSTIIKNRYLGDAYDDRFFAAIDAVAGPDGKPTCRANLDASWSPNQPFISLFPVRDLRGPTTFSKGQCVPVNLFGEGSPSADAKKFIRADTTDRSKITQQVAAVQLLGPVGRLSPFSRQVVQFALGGEYRREESRFSPDPLASEGLTFTNAIAREAGIFDVKEAFIELNLPLIDDRRFIEKLNFAGAARLSDYSTVGRTVTWKTDAYYSPLAGIAAHGTVAKAVRAPNIGELFAGRSQSFQFITDPCNFNQLQNGGAHRRANCAAILANLGVKDPSSFQDPRVATIVGWKGGNPDLNAERAFTWTLGVTVQDPVRPTTYFRADWYDIDINQAISLVQPQQLAELCVDQPDPQNVYCSGIERTQDGPRAGLISGFAVTPRNVAGYRTSGLDLNLSHLQRTSVGTFTISAVANYLRSLALVGAPGAPATELVGTARVPRFQSRLELGWSRGGYSLAYAASWFSRTSRYSRDTLKTNPDVVAPQYRYLKQRLVHDLSFATEVGSTAKFRIGVRNLFGTRPALASRDYPVSSTGRYLFAGFSVE